MKARTERVKPATDVVEWELFSQINGGSPEKKRETANIFERWAELARRAADLEEGKLPSEARN